MIPSLRARSVLLLGPTGAGKTPLGAYLEEHGFNGKRYFHFDFGHQLRTIAGCGLPPEGFTREDHSFIKAVLEKGLLLENESFFIAEKIITLFLARSNFRDSDILVLNGLPRHVGQAGDMEKIVDIKDIIVLECSPENVYRRIRYNTGCDRAERIDDDIGMVRKKLTIFRGRTAPLVEYYAHAGCKVYSFEVTSSSTAKDVFNDLRRCVQQSTSD
jgi:adenylate kinase